MTIADRMKKLAEGLTNFKGPGPDDPGGTKGTIALWKACQVVGKLYDTHAKGALNRLAKGHGESVTMDIDMLEDLGKFIRANRIYFGDS